MGQIYPNAETTSIESGPEADQSEVVGAWVQAYSEVVEIVSAADKTEIPTEFDLEGPICSVLFPHLYASTWTPLTDLLLRPWFLHVWIIQEVIYSQKLYTSCGAWTLHWEEFSNAIVSYMAQLASLDQPGPWEQEVRFQRKRAAKQIGTLSKLRRQSYAEWDEKYKMIFMLKLLSGTHATEPCDYFFGILVLCKEKDDPSLQLNYAHSYADTLLRCCKSFISRGQVFDILNGTSPSAWAAELPSWIPDWRAGKLSEFRSFIEGMGGGDWHYQAATKEVAKVHVREHSCELVIEGFVFDSIRKLGPNMLTAIPPKKNKWTRRERSSLDILLRPSHCTGLKESTALMTTISEQRKQQRSCRGSTARSMPTAPVSFLRKYSIQRPNKLKLKSFMLLS
jgi:hypothetical protein